MLLRCLLLQGVYLISHFLYCSIPSVNCLFGSLAYQTRCNALELVRKLGRGHTAGFLLFSSKCCNKLQWLLSPLLVINMHTCMHTTNMHKIYTDFFLIICHGELRYNCSIFVIHSHFPYDIFTLSFSASIDNL